jgi:hypothetical protein
MTEKDQRPNFIQVIGSVLAAFFGVQSNKNRERDFKHGKASHFIIAGLLMTGVFVLLVWGVVRLVLRVANAFPP